MDLSKIMFVGRLTRNPETKYTTAGLAICNFAIACGRFKKDETDFYECVAFKAKAEFIEKYLGKGNRAIVTGRLQIEPYEDKDGFKRKAAKIIVEDVQPIDWKEGSTSGSKPPTEVKKPATAAIDTGDELPF